MALTTVIIINAILALAIVVAIVGSHAWAVATAHRDHRIHVVIAPSGDDLQAIELDSVPQLGTELAIA